MSDPSYDATKADERLLGYGNRANLVIYPLQHPDTDVNVHLGIGTIQWRGVGSIVPET